MSKAPTPKADQLRAMRLAKYVKAEDRAPLNKVINATRKRMLDQVAKRKKP
jgi:hypothetical protein